MAQALDFPGAVTQGKDLDDAREMLQSALVDLAEVLIDQGKPLPKPDPSVSDPDAEIEEPIYLLLEAASQVKVVPVRTAG